MSIISELGLAMNLCPDKPPTVQDIVEAHRKRSISPYKKLLALCDGDWTTETPLDIAEIACNTINRRNDKIDELAKEHQIMREALVEVIECKTGLSSYMIARRTLEKLISGSRMKCTFCCKDDSTVAMRVDPYSREINDEDIELPMCPECQQDRRDDI